MVLNRIRRAATWAGLAGALALVLPVGTASAAPHGQPTPLTVTPEFAERTALAGQEDSLDGFVQVAGDVYFRVGGYYGPRRSYGPRGYYGPRRYYGARPYRRYRPRVYHEGRWWRYRDGYYYDNAGAAIAAGIIGLAAGAIAGQALAAPNTTVVIEEPYARQYVPAPYTAEWYRRCDLKYRSFRARDGTYLGYDGVRHVCRLP